MLFPMRFLTFSLVFLIFSMMFAKTSLLFCYFCIRLLQTSMLLFVFRIMLVLIRVFRELDRYGLERVINLLCQFFPLKENLCNSQWQRLRGKIVFEHLEQLASPNLDSHNQKSVFDRVETLYNTDVSVRWGNIIMLWLNDWHLVKVF